MGIGPAVSRQHYELPDGLQTDAIILYSAPCIRVRRPTGLARAGAAGWNCAFENSRRRKCSGITVKRFLGRN